MFHCRLPEDVMWFEPPSVCRWETVAETKISEELENGFSVEPSRPSRKILNERKVLDDFNLLNLPRGLNLYALMQDFVVPRLPDGYCVRIGETIVDKKNNQKRCKSESVLN